jgi:hypothetical protein
MQSVDGLSEEAKIAYQAFLDMIQTKYESGGAPSITESLELEKLLANHDKNVLAFKTAMAAVTDCDEKKSLVELMS